MQKRLGKLIPIEEIEKTLKDKMESKELEEAMNKLLKAGDLFRPKRGYIQKM